MAEYVRLDDVSSGVKPPRMFHLGKYSFSNIEAKHLLLALVMITLTLMVLQRGLLQNIGIINFIIIFFVTVGLGFLFHELGHKLVAQYYGFISEFRADFPMMVLALIVAITGFTFLAPGAVMIWGRVSVRQNGIISVAGPIVNLVLAALFALWGLLFNPTGLLGLTVYLGIWINAFLGIFNMLPFWILDGKKVLAWNKPVYFIVMGLLIFFLVGALFGWFGVSF